MVLSIVLGEHVDSWYRIAWAVSGGSAMEARRIYHEMPMHELMALYAMQCHSNSFRPRIKKTK